MNSSNSLKTQHLKKSLLLALTKCNGNVSAACKAVKCDRTTFYAYYNKDKKFKTAVEEISNVALDVVEDALFKKIKKGDTIAIIFYLKTKGKARGYIERQEVDVRDLKIKVTRK